LSADVALASGCFFAAEPPGIEPCGPKLANAAKIRDLEPHSMTTFGPSARAKLRVATAASGLWTHISGPHLLHSASVSTWTKPRCAASQLLKAVLPRRRRTGTGHPDRRWRRRDRHGHLLRRSIRLPLTDLASRLGQRDPNPDALLYPRKAPLSLISRMPSCDLQVAGDVLVVALPGQRGGPVG